MRQLDRCSICPCTFRPIPGEGDTPCPIMVIGDRPGKEHRLGLPIAGGAGKELDAYLRLAGLDRSDVYITNTVKCFTEGNRKTSDKEIRECGTCHLPDEISACDPALIILMGGPACSLIDHCDLDHDHGIPLFSNVLGWEGPVVPMYHPNAGLHDTAKMTPLLEDFERLKGVLAGTWAHPENLHPHPEYRLIQTLGDLKGQLYRIAYPANIYQAPFVALDTERHGQTAYSVQFSFIPGRAYMIRADEPKLLNYLSGWLAEEEAVLHNAPQDLDWLDRMGIRVNRFRDTMQEAFHLGNLPQGLKALAYRLLGIRMRTYIDVVEPHSRDALVHWMFTGLDHAEQVLQVTSYKQLKTKLKEIRKPSEVERALRRIIRYTLDSPSYDPWEKLEDTRAKDPDGMRSVESTCGPAPILGIGNVPLDEQIPYACGDADITLRVAIELQKRRDTLMTGDWAVTDSDKDNITL